MKNFTKIFMAVVAGMFAFSCVTDTTVDQTVELGNEANGVVKTVLSVSIANSEELRTQLGDAGSHGYPMYWSNGDKISANGIESNELVLGEDEKINVVDFTFGQNLSTPYCVTYPAAAEGQVVFKAYQSHAGNNTFGDNVATMWGYSENGDGVSLKHLTGVIKIGVVVDEALGEKNLVYAQVSTIDRTPIAGAFNFDFENGVLGEPTETASEVINYSFGEGGVALSTTEPTYLHLAVPAGKYEELYVTLYDEDGGVMYATVKAGDKKPLAAGKVREFKKDGVEQLITYAPNAEVFVVREANDLVTLSEKMAEAKAANTVFTKDVLFVSDIDMEGTEWTPLTLDTRRTVDSKPVVSTIHGNGYAIKNLKAPLFNYLYASVKGLHLKNVNINETVDPCVGTLARRAGWGNSSYPLVIENCTATGTINVNCPNKGKTNEDYSDYSTGGICGVAFATTLQNLTSDVDITIEQVIASSALVSTVNGVQACVGGIVGNTDKVSSYNTHFINLENKGDITYSDCSWTTSPTVSTSANAAAKGTLGLYLGGLIGSSASANGQATFLNLTNRGNLTLDGGNYAMVRIGGIGASIHTNLYSNKQVTSSGNSGKNFNNYGTVTVSGGSIRMLYASGGIGWSAEGSRWEDVHNHESGAFTLGENATILSFVVGGVMGYHPNGEIGVVTEETGHAAMVACTNAAPITVKCKTAEEHTATTEFYYRVGGIAGWTQSLITRCTNSGDITCDGSFFHNHSTSTYLTAVGGISGYKTINYITNSQNSGNISVNWNMSTGSNSGFVTKEVQVKDEAGNVTGTKTETTISVIATAYAGGVVGYSHVKMDDCENEGDVQLTGKLILAKIGGVAGTINDGTSNRLKNSGNVTLGAAGKETTVENLIWVGGVTGQQGAATTFENSGNVYVGHNVHGKSDAYIGGVIAENPKNKTVTSFTNTGNVTVGQLKTDGAAFIGGAIGYTNAALNRHTNLGSVTVTNEIETGSSLHVGGVVGRCLFSIADGNWLKNGEEGSTTKGAVTVSGTVTSYTAIGGCVGSCIQSQTTLYNTTNYGKVSVTPVKFTEESYIGGVVGFVQSPRQEFTWSGTTKALQYNVNSGDKRTELKNNTNHGDVEVTSNANCGSLMVGGVAGMASGKANDLTNNGKVTIKGTLPASGRRVFEYTSPSMIGGVIGTGVCGYNVAAGNGGAGVAKTYKYDNLVNNAEVKLDGVTYSKYVCLGGVVGWIPEYTYYTLSNSAASSSSSKATNFEVDIYNVVNNGPVTITNATNTSAQFIGGVGGFLGGEVHQTTNNGKISVNHTANSAAAVQIGGIGYQIKDTSTDVTNNGDIEVTGAVSKSGTTATLYAGGFIGNKNNYVRTRCNNNGDIYVGTESVPATLYKDCFIGGMMYDGSDSATQTLKDCHNTGDITLASNSTVNGALMFAGLVGKVQNDAAASTLKIDGCSNSGNLTVKGTVKGDSHIAGMVAVNRKASLILQSGGFTNTGKLEFAGKSTAAAATTCRVYMGGCVASCESSGKFKYNDSNKWTGTAKNTGKLVHSGSTNGTIMIGGIFGYLSSSSTDSEVALPTTATYINDGEIEVTGTYYTTALGWNSIGGIIGNTNRDAADKQLILKNATTTDKCKITAWGFPRIGMLIGNTRTANRYATNCSVAGTIDKGKNGQHYDPTEDATVDGWYSFEETLTAETFHNYIYSTAVDASVAANDVCSFYVAPTPEPEPTPAE